MANKAPTNRKIPAGTQDAARLLWESLSPADRKELQDLLNALPNEASMMRLLLKLATSTMRTTFGRKQKVAIVGPTNVGKSTLYNQLVERKEEKAAVSPIPGTTRVNQAGDAGLFTLVDTPGADAVGEVGEREQEEALNAAQEADFLIIVFDAIQGIKRTELELYDQLVDLGKPHVVILNKIDLVRRESDAAVADAARTLRLDPSDILPVVAKTGENLDDVMAAIAVAEPEIVAALGQALPKYRWQLAWRTIVRSASASAVIALTPLPLIDFIPLTVTQSIMVLGIARIYNYQLTLARARELVLTFGLGFLGRTLFQQLSKFAGVPGWVLAAAIASSTTVVMGYAATVWFETGERLSQETLKHLTSEITQQLLGSIKNLGKRKPGKETLQQEIEEALQDAPISDRETLHQKANKATENK